MIIPVYRVVTTQVPIASDYSSSIEPGQVIKLNSSTGKAELCGATTDIPFGLAADRYRAAESYEWTNRVSDFGQETRASGMLSVYNGGGEFYVDVHDSNVTTPNGTAIAGVIAAASAGAGYGVALYNAASGQMSTSNAGSATKVANVIETAAALSSGIPGEFEPNSVSADYDYDGTGARTWIKIKLAI